MIRHIIQFILHGSILLKHKNVWSKSIYKENDVIMVWHVYHFRRFNIGERYQIDIQTDTSKINWKCGLKIKKKKKINRQADSSTQIGIFLSDIEYCLPNRYVLAELLRSFQRGKFRQFLS